MVVLVDAQPLHLELSKAITAEEAQVQAPLSGVGSVYRPQPNTPPLSSGQGAVV